MTDIPVIDDGLETVERRQLARDDFMCQLFRTYPNKEDGERKTCLSLADQWWPGTVASPSEEAGEPVEPQTTEDDLWEEPTDV